MESESTTPKTVTVTTNRNTTWLRRGEVAVMEWTPRVDLAVRTGRLTIVDGDIPPSHPDTPAPTDTDTDTDDLTEATRPQLVARARALDVVGAAQMKKADLIEAILAVTADSDASSPEVSDEADTEADTAPETPAQVSDSLHLDRGPQNANVEALVSNGDHTDTPNYTDEEDSPQ